ncbi:ethanolamine ammonia-lyase subunit EutC [Pseudoramibacter sp.]|jgi:ethanolamine ammonia-lyase small subunit|uniref:ethanolamine ammonia-lyase subunit EutC n=1 Tax=Pseudoramibacter sp. TaxID=2034862 RepID=UPI0025D47A69|nr:ethanolamine ammonia-lyase subunit EutC [Pseudoramibacter sp.]MCH4071394.1 ethanolamine ammonia-lyase subunit EutC [Pseudoramibacter sp.]MCH4105162.1 ethanolamine ammonia-lyase subunit EutC [Pseudoramibacter sp.]
MVNEQTIKDIVQQVLGDIDVSKFLDDDKESEAPATAFKTGEVCEEGEAGEIPDITKIDIRTQYLVNHPKHGEEYAKLKAKAPCRLGIGKAGARYKTLPVLEFRAAHSAAQDAVFTDVDPAFIEKMGLFTIQSQCRDKDEYLTRPDLGRKLSEEGAKMVDEKCVKHPKVQIYIADGLSSAAIEANANEVYPAIVQGLKSHGIDVGTPFFLKYGRVASMDQISEITGADVTCVLIGERPGLITAQSMSAYMAYKATVGMPEARRTVISNIHKEGTNPAEAGAHIADILLKMLETKSSGTDLKL